MNERRATSQNTGDGAFGSPAEAPAARGAGPGARWVPRVPGFVCARGVRTGPAGGVWLAHVEGATPTEATHVVRACVDVPLFAPAGAGPSGAGAAQRFAARCERQRMLTARASASDGVGRGHVVSLVASGPLGDGAGAYDVVARYGTSAAMLSAGRTRMQPHVLYEVVSGVLSALAAVGEADGGRPHGAVRAGHVLIDDREGPTRWRVGLDHPQSEAALGLDLGRALMHDLRGVGEVIHELVLHKPFQELGGYPIVSGPEWAGLGKLAPRWIELANALLDPRARPGDLTLEGVRRAVLALEARPRSPQRKIVAAAAVGVLVLCGGVAVAAHELHKQRERVQEIRAEFVYDDYVRWCEAYEDWFGRFTTVDLPAAREELSRDAHLAGTMLAAIAAVEANPRLTLDPKAAANKQIQARTYREMPALLLERPDLQDEDLGGQVKFAVAAVDAAANAAEAWPLRGALRTRAEAYEADTRPWAGPIAALLRASDVADARAPGAAAAMARALRLDAACTRLDAVDAAIADAARRLAAAGEATPSGDPEDGLLRAFSAFAEAERLRALAGAGDGGAGNGGAENGGADLAAVERLLARAEELRDLGERLAAFAEAGFAGVDREAFAAGGTALRRFTEAGGTGAAATAELYAAWLVEAQSAAFAALDPTQDPRRAWAAPETLARAQGVIAELRRVLREVAERELTRARPGDPSLDERVRAAAAEVEAVRALRWNRAARDRVQIETARLSAAAEQLLLDAERLNAQLTVDQTQYLAELRARGVVSGDGLASVDAAFVRRRDELLAAFDAGGEFYTLFRGVLGAEQFAAELEQRLRVEPEMPRTPRGFSGPALRRSVLARRDAAARTVLEGVVWSESGVQAESAALAHAESLAEQERAWLGRVGELVGLYAEIDERLAAWRLPDEASGARAGASAGTIDALAGEAEASELLRDAGVQGSVAATRARLRALRETLASDDPVALVASSRLDAGTPTEVAHAAYLRLHDVGGGAWPAGPADVAGDLDRRDALLDAARASLGAARAREVEQRLRAMSRERWGRALARAADAAGVTLAMAAAPRAGVSPGDDLSDLPASAAFNAALHNAATATLPTVLTEDEATLRAVAGRLHAELDALASRMADEGLPLDEAGRAWLEKLAELKVPPEQLAASVEPQDIGPGRASGSPWEPEEVVEIDRITYHWPSAAAPEFSLTFALVEDEAGSGLSEPWYVCTQEVSLGLFRHIVEAHAGGYGAFAERALWRQLRDARDPAGMTTWPGPRVWAWDAAARAPGAGEPGRLVPNATWLAPHPQLKEFPAYPPELGPQDASGRIAESQGSPSLEHPMNAVSYGAAWHAARALGCAIAPPAVWSAARAQLEPSATTGADAAWNLRDETVARQAQHVEAAARKIGGATLFSEPTVGSIWSDEQPPAGEAAPTLGDDGRLWFDTVDGARGRTLRHLVGNVAEWAALEPADGNPDDPVDDRVFVIGGSALSPPWVAAEEARPVRSRVSGRIGYGHADVGFRLAFAPGGGLRQSINKRLNRLLQTPPYVLAVATGDASPAVAGEAP